MSFLVSDWMRTVFVHYEVDPVVLQKLVPFELDLRDGKAYVSLVAFTLENLRLQLPIRVLPNHSFLNVRTYVRHGGEPGIYFLAEWLNHLPAVFLGPRLYGLPYRYGRLDYSLTRRTVREHGLRLDFEVTHGSVDYAPSASGSIDEFVVERYSAFTKRGRVERLFRVRHDPWPIAPVSIRVLDSALLRSTGDWLDHARPIGAHYSPGVHRVSITPPIVFPVRRFPQACGKRRT